jgi:hypothetical protein
MRPFVILPLALAGTLAFAVRALQSSPARLGSPTSSTDGSLRMLDVRADTARELRGTYETGFEVSWFHPCGAQTGDDLWWVTLSDAALRQRDSLAKKLTGQPRAVFVRWRGTTSDKIALGAGHMGRGSRYVFVTEILELRSAEEAGCTAA